MKDLRSFFHVLLLFVLYLLLTGTSLAQNQYYISPTGSDNNNGLTPATAWATINHADAALTVGAGGSNCGTDSLATTNVGACVHVLPGVYGQAVTTNKRGTASARIRYISDVSFGAKITGSGAAVLWSVFGDYTDIVGFEFDGSVNTSCNGVVFYSTPSNGWATHGWFLYNKMHDLCKNGDQLGTGVLQTSNTLSDPDLGGFNTFERNFIYHNATGFGHEGQGSSNTSLQMGNGDIARNNVIIDQGYGFCIQLSHTSHLKNVITNNTIARCDRGGIGIGFTSGGGVDNATITNNIVVNNGFGSQATWGIVIFSSGGCGANNIYRNNLLYGNSPANWRFPTGCTDTSSGTQNGSDSTTFVNYTGTFTGDYRLKPNSPAINSGTSACAPGVSNCVPVRDLEGNQRPQGPAADIGSYELLATDTPAPPTDLAASVN